MHQLLAQTPGPMQEYSARHRCAGRGQSSTDQTTRRISQDLRTVDSTSAEEGEMVGQDDFVSNALPSFPLANPPNFTWGEQDGVKVKDDIDRIYSEVVHWRHNLFKIPSGKHGKDFVHEMARLFNSYAEASSMEGVAIKAAMVFPALVLQKPFKTSRSKDHSKCLERRMKEWEAGHFLALFGEAKAIQARLSVNAVPQHSKPTSRRFAELMMSGKVKAATRLIMEENHSSRLPLNHVIEGKSVRDILQEKHPPPCQVDITTVTPPMMNLIPSHPALFDEIDGLTILKSVLSTEGSAGPSGMDASLWRRMLFLSECILSSAGCFSQHCKKNLLKLCRPGAPQASSSL